MQGVLSLAGRLLHGGPAGSDCCPGVASQLAAQLFLTQLSPFILPPGNYELALGALTGAGMFVGCVVAGRIVTLSGGAKARGAQIRDVLTQFITVATVLGIGAFCCLLLCCCCALLPCAPVCCCAGLPCGCCSLLLCAAAPGKPKVHNVPQSAAPPPAIAVATGYFSYGSVATLLSIYAAYVVSSCVRFMQC